jgi:hypothetical protein
MIKIIFIHICFFSNWVIAGNDPELTLNIVNKDDEIVKRVKYQKTLDLEKIVIYVPESSGEIKLISYGSSFDKRYKQEAIVFSFNRDKRPDFQIDFQKNKICSILGKKIFFDGPLFKKTKDASTKDDAGVKIVIKNHKKNIYHDYLIDSGNGYSYTKGIKEDEIEAIKKVVADLKQGRVTEYQCDLNAKKITNKERSSFYFIVDFIYNKRVKSFTYEKFDKDYYKYRELKKKQLEVSRVLTIRYGNSYKATFLISVKKSTKICVFPLILKPSP